MTLTTYRVVDVDGFDVFYREAGKLDSPTLLLLHGFPTSSHMFRDLIPLLADRFHLIAPDLPGFGQTTWPSRERFSWSFDELAKVIDRFVERVGLDRFAIYVFDYGAPVGLRVALARPDRITAIISQNGNAYEDGLGKAWAPFERYWHDPTRANRDALRELLTPTSVRAQYTHGVQEPSLVSPDGSALDSYYLTRPGVVEAQLDLFRDYATNVALYPAFQAYFRKEQPPLLAVWGRNDPFFLPAGAEAFQRDLPDAEVHLFDTGHFALETHAREIASTIARFMTD
jgi:pimeloyl-ACP methyl ester carboxylesterase